MSDDTEKTLENLTDMDSEDKDKLKKLMEKDAKTFRKPTGFWHWVVALLGAALVVFYFYAAGVASVGTQYHLGIYVFITYVLVFLLYPVGAPWIRGVMNLGLAFLLTSVLAILFVFKDHIVYYQHIMGLAETFKGDGVGAGLAQAMSLWPLFLVTIVLAVGLHVVDVWCAKKWDNQPTSSDVLFALAAAGVVYYWLSQFEALNWRAGAENELDALISITGILISFEVCRRVLGWSMTLIGASMIAFAYFGPYLPSILAHRGFSFERISNALFLTTNGVFGVMANVLAT